MRKVDQLWELQRLDDEIALLEQKVQEWVGRRHRQQQTLIRSQQIRQETEKKLRQQEQQLRQAEWTLEDVEKRLQTVEERLYSQAIRSAKEAEAMQTEIEALRAQQEALENTTLQQMLELDTLQVQVEEAIEAEERQAQSYESFLQTAAAEEKTLQEEIELLRKRRAAAAAEIDPPILRRYESLLQTKGGMAVAQVVENTCQGCHLEVAILTRKAAQEDALVYCEYCGRILYLA